MPQPEIISPRDRTLQKRSPLSDESLDQIATVLDECFRIPGTHIRVGVDAIIGLIPGLGDLIGGLLSLIFVIAAFVRGLPKIAILRMVVNIGLDVSLGAVPFLGDAFDAWWKVNRRNYNVLMRYHRSTSTKREVLKDGLFLLLVAALFFVMMLLPIAVIWIIVQWIRR